MYTGEFDEDWIRYFQNLDSKMKERVAKKINNILEHPQKRHLKGASFFVDEIGQYRVVYRIFDENKRVRFYFVGKHKEYEIWYRQIF
jgi:mRNA-degrading endonuclease RelE of RelBE toxin-antitoxin system